MAKNIIKFKKEKKEKVIYVENRHEKINKKISIKISGLLILSILCLSLILAMFTGWISPKKQSFLEINKNQMTIQALPLEQAEKAKEEKRNFASLFKTVFGTITDVKKHNGKEFVVYNEEEQKKDLFDLTFDKLYTKKAMYNFNFKGWLFTNKNINLTIDYSNYYTIFDYTGNKKTIIKTSNDINNLKKHLKENIEENNLYDWYKIVDNTKSIEENKKEENKISLTKEELIDAFDFKVNIFRVKK